MISDDDDTLMISSSNVVVPNSKKLRMGQMKRKKQWNRRGRGKTRSMHA